MNLIPFRRGPRVGLDDPKQPDEVVWKPLQLWLKAIFVGMLVVAALVGGGNCVQNASLGENDDRIDGVLTDLRAQNSELEAQNRELKRQYDELVATRTEGRVTACQSDRDFQLNHNKLADAAANLPRIVFTDTAQRLSEEQRGPTIAYGETLARGFEITKVPVRVCDGPSIALFYESKGVLGCEPTPADSAGHCKEEA